MKARGNAGRGVRGALVDVRELVDTLAYGGVLAGLLHGSPGVPFRGRRPFCSRDYDRPRDRRTEHGGAVVRLIARFWIRFFFERVEVAAP